MDVQSRSDQERNASDPCQSHSSSNCANDEALKVYLINVILTNSNLKPRLYFARPVWFPFRTPIIKHHEKLRYSWIITFQCYRSRSNAVMTPFCLQTWPPRTPPPISLGPAHLKQTTDHFHLELVTPNSIEGLIVIHVIFHQQGMGFDQK